MFGEIDCLKQEQVISIVQYIMKKDVFVVLATGFGKFVSYKSSCVSARCCWPVVSAIPRIQSLSLFVLWYHY